MEENKLRTWKVNFYKNARGDEPIKEFISQQDEATRAKILSAIMSLKTGGPFLMPPYMKKIENSLYELRISGKIAIRIFYTLQRGEYYLLNIFKKKTQKTPLQELKTARERLKEVVLDKYIAYMLYSYL